MTTREPACYALLGMGLLLCLFSAHTYQFALQLEREPHQFFAADWRTKKLLTYIIANKYQPVLGSEGCACIVAVPALLVLGFGFWDLRRWCRSSDESGERRGP
jgi:hypothetical protein